jgi:hypothetical protein
MEDGQPVTSVFELQLAMVNPEVHRCLTGRTVGLLHLCLIQVQMFMERAAVADSRRHACHPATLHQQAGACVFACLSLPCMLDRHNCCTTAHHSTSADIQERHVDRHAHKQQTFMCCCWQPEADNAKTSSQQISNAGV